MFAATTSPWYLPTWVSGQMPVTSPIAHSRSPARRRASTGTPCGSASMPTVSRPMPSTRGRRPVATSRRSPRSSRPSSSSSDVVLAVAPRGGRVHAERELDAVAAQDLAERLAERRGLARQHVLGRPRRAPPRRRGGARPAPSRRRPGRRRARAAGAGPPSCRSPRGSSRRPSSSRRPGTGGMNGSAPFARTTCSAVWRTPSTSTAPGPGEPAAAAQQVDARARPASAPARRRSSSRP